MDRQVGEFFTPVEEGQFNEKINFGDLDVKVVLDQLDGGRNGASGGEYVIHDENFLTGLEGIAMDFDGVGSIFKFIGLPMDGVGELTGLSHEAGASAQSIGERFII